jgi:hypothetical protein
MSLPGLLDPVEINEKLLLDGGLANNFPASDCKPALMLSLLSTAPLVVAAITEINPPNNDCFIISSLNIYI